jgi:hypothetical protein
VVLDSVVVPDGNWGCAHGGAGCVAGASAGGCCVASVGLILPLLDLFMAGIVIDIRR